MSLSPLQNIGPAAVGEARAARPVAAVPNPAPAQPAASPRPEQVEQVEQAVQQIRDVVEPVAQSLQFSVDEDTGKTVVKVIDSTTQKIVRQMPSEEVLAVARALDRLQGLLLKSEA